MAVRGRLARVRERLRRRLLLRGVTVPSVLLVASEGGVAQASVPVSLIHSTVQIGLGFVAANATAVLCGGH